MDYISSKFDENILNGLRVMERTRFVTDRQTETHIQTDRLLWKKQYVSFGEGGGET